MDNFIVNIDNIYNVSTTYCFCRKYKMFKWKLSTLAAQCPAQRSLLPPTLHCLHKIIMLLIYWSKQRGVFAVTCNISCAAAREGGSQHWPLRNCGHWTKGAQLWPSRKWTYLTDPTQNGANKCPNICCYNPTHCPWCEVYLCGGAVLQCYRCEVSGRGRCGVRGGRGERRGE